MDEDAGTQNGHKKYDQMTVDFGVKAGFPTYDAPPRVIEVVSPSRALLYFGLGLLLAALITGTVAAFGMGWLPW